MDVCEKVLLGICLTRPPLNETAGIFGFAEFVTAFALLILVYNATDPLYRFRISVAPLPVFRITFWSITLIGLGSLGSDLWFAQRWPAPALGVSQAVIQAILGATFLSVALLWLWFAFVSPPKFGKSNYLRFSGSLYGVIVKGSDKELSQVAGELIRSAAPLIKFSSAAARREATPPAVSQHAYDILLLLANRKMCRNIVHHSPTTAIAIMREASIANIAGLPLSQFAKNITSEALLYSDSPLYHENNLHTSGLLGYVRPFKNALYGDYKLVETLARQSSSPLDIGWTLSSSLTVTQLEAYLDAVLVTFSNFVELKSCNEHSISLYRALDVARHCAIGIRDGANEDMPPDISPRRKLGLAARFSAKMVEILQDSETLPTPPTVRPKGVKPRGDNSIYAHIAELMYQLIFLASKVKSSPEEAWRIQQNAVWSQIFSYRDNDAAWRAISSRLRRRIYDHVVELETLPNYSSSKILGMCLNVMDLSETYSGGDRGYAALQKVVMRWTKRHYMTLAEKHHLVAADCLSGGITFDAAERRLVKTYFLGLGLEPARSYLNLDPARAT